MKYEDYIKMRRVGCVALLGLGVVGGFLACNRTQATSPSLPPAQNLPASQNPPETPPIASNDPLLVTDVQKEIMRLQQQPLTVEGAKNTGDGIQWRMKDNGITAEFRSDTSKGFTTWNRAKVDYNGNKKYDERWDFKGNTIRRRVSPSDDENYTEEYTINTKSGNKESKWVKK